MAGDDFAVERIDDIEAIMRGGFRKARAALGVTSFGIQVIELPPDFEHYPEHDHADDGQEEVFAVLRGAGEIEIAGERHPLDPDHLVRVAPGVARKLWPGSQGMRLLAIGGIPGEAYRIKSFTELGEPDPFA